MLAGEACGGAAVRSSRGKLVVDFEGGKGVRRQTPGKEVFEVRVAECDGDEDGIRYQ